jgi:hypothetical protein
MQRSIDKVRKQRSRDAGSRHYGPEERRHVKLHVQLKSQEDEEMDIRVADVAE